MAVRKQLGGISVLYEIKNERYTVKVDTLGAQLMSWQGENGFEYIWTGDPAYWTSRAPVLFPMVGALRAGKTRIDGNWFEMGQHGFARRREFACRERSAHAVSLVLEADEETKKLYPFDFLLTVTYTLEGDSLTTAFSVTNTGTRSMPFAVGGHPGYRIPVNEEAAFEDYTICFEQPETQRCPAIVMGQGLIDPSETAFTLQEQREIPLTHQLFYRDALIFENLRSQKVQVVNKATGKGVEMDFSQFPMFGIWSAKNDGPYVCLEPWTGCATRTDEGDEFREKKGMILLAPGQTREFSFRTRIL